MLFFSLHRGRPAVQGVPGPSYYKPLQGVVNLLILVLSIPVALVSPDLGKFCWLGFALSPRIASLIASRGNTRRAA